jgi:hypothetical protein
MTDWSLYMGVRYAIGPSIGVARVGNSPDSFYIAPDAIAALPIECDEQGTPIFDSGILRRVNRFKDPQGRIRRQAAQFRIFRMEDGQAGAVEITLADPTVRSIHWTVHLANKKACWYSFAELQGNLLYGAKNSYKKQKVPLRNADVAGTDKRRKLIVDPGPRSLSGPSKRAEFSKNTVPPKYKFASFPGKVVYGEQITTLGSMLTDSEGRLLVLGGFGFSGGDQSIASFGGADTWHDDISDGPVHCTIEWKSGKKTELDAWCLIGSPKFVPEIANIVTLDDTMYDVAVRHFDYAPQIFAKGKFNANHVADFERDIRPILERPGAYRWVANLPSMNSLSPPPFDPKDKTAATATLRAAYLGLYRKPNPENKLGPDNNTLFSPGGFPLMPLNSGSNSVSNDGVDKFLTLTETQYFLLGQWAKGKFNVSPPAADDIVTSLSRAAVGNCVGGPFCPGIEVTWNSRNPNIYAKPFVIRQRHDQDWYFKNGLDPDIDETADRKGCEPGDLTKRMAIPWQADFFQCSIEFINFTDPTRNSDDNDDFAVPPTYYSYWWPPQSPWQVITGDLTVAEQTVAGTPAGFQVGYSRGINTFAQMITSWYYMGFVVNQVNAPHREAFPYFTEQERNHAGFIASSVAVGDASNVQTGTDTNFANTWFLPPTPPVAPQQLMELAKAAPGEAEYAVQQSRAVSFGTSRQHGRRPFRR